jgi:hypothetical protein
MIKVFFTTLISLHTHCLEERQHHYHDIKSVSTIQIFTNVKSTFTNSIRLESVAITAIKTTALMEALPSETQKKFHPLSILF